MQSKDHTATGKQLILPHLSAVCLILVAVNRTGSHCYRAGHSTSLLCTPQAVPVPGLPPLCKALFYTEGLTNILRSFPLEHTGKALLITSRKPLMSK